MNKKNKVKKERENYRRVQLHLKELRRKDKFQAFNGVDSKVQKSFIKHDSILIDKLKDNAFKPFAFWITPGSGQITVEIPKHFCFCTHYEECLVAIKLLASSMYDYLGYKISLDFSKCAKVDTAALFIVQVVRLEISRRIQHIQNNLKFLTIVPEMVVIPPKSRDVVRLLLNLGFPVNEEDIIKADKDSTLVPIDNLGYLRGRKTQKHYLENKKSVSTTIVVKYLNSCLKFHGYELAEQEVNSIDGLIGEVLSNAEDHSGNNLWFLTANFSKELLYSELDDVGEMNLTILNFGNSIYEAFMDTKDKNIEIYNQVEGYAKNIMSKPNTNNFSEEQLFLLATMQDQISRLKFERESRGTGTMKFINSFLELGDYENKAKGYVPNLSLFSGAVQLICDNKYKPFRKDEVYCLSLNPENDLRKAPDSSHLKGLSQKFPGTLISVKIYINKKHWDIKYGGNHHAN